MTTTEPAARDRAAPPPVTLAGSVPVWARIAALSFGGPAGQIAVMHRVLVEEKRWISENRFLHALNFCTLLPGPEAQQLATYVGWLMHGTRGGLLAGGLFVLPGILAIMALSWIYVLYGEAGPVAGLFFGLKAAVLAIVLEAVQRIGRRALRGPAMTALAAAAFAPCFLWIFVGAPFVERLRGNAALAGALSAITAAAVGVILNLAVWFSLHTLFRAVRPVAFGPLRLDVPVAATLDPWALVLALAATVAVFRFRAGMIPVLAACAAAGVGLRLVGAI